MALIYMALHVIFMLLFSYIELKSCNVILSAPIASILILIRKLDEINVKYKYNWHLLIQSNTPLIGSWTTFIYFLKWLRKKMKSWRTLFIYSLLIFYNGVTSALIVCIHISLPELRAFFIFLFWTAFWWSLNWSLLFAFQRYHPSPLK